MCVWNSASMPSTVRCIASTAKSKSSADRVAAGLAGEVGDHVAALHLAVHEHIEADALLAADPVLRGLALELIELGAVDLALGELGAGLGEVFGLGIGADGVCDQCGHGLPHLVVILRGET